MNNLTALMSAFVRAYHTKTAKHSIIRDEFSGIILGSDYAAIAQRLMVGRAYFLPDFPGDDEEALTVIAGEKLGAAVLGRAAYNAAMLENAHMLGCRQFLLPASGYSGEGLTQAKKGWQVYEADLPELLAEKQRRMKEAGWTAHENLHFLPGDLSQNGWTADLLKAGFDPKKRSFISLMGLCHYLTEDAFRRLLGCLAGLAAPGTALCMDYPLPRHQGQTRELARAAGEAMQAQYTASHMEKLLAEAGFGVYEHLAPAALDRMIFAPYREREADHPIFADKGTGLVLAVKQP